MPTVIDFILHSLNGPNSPIDFNSSFAWVIVMWAGHDWKGLIPIYRKCVWNRIEMSRECSQVIIACVVKRVWVRCKVILALKVKLPDLIPCLSFLFPSIIAFTVFFIGLFPPFLARFFQGPESWMVILRTALSSSVMILCSPKVVM